MRGRRPWPNTLGLICVALGVLVILSMVLPSGFWWLLLGIGLIVFGLYLIKRCC